MEPVDAVATRMVDGALQVLPKPTRRQLLVSSTALALLALTRTPATGADRERFPARPPKLRGQPFGDGTFFDDGFGWVP